MSKMKSRKFWFAIWGAVAATVLGIFSILKGYDGSWLPGTMALLVGIVTAYVAIGAAKKPGEK